MTPLNPAEDGTLQLRPVRHPGITWRPVSEEEIVLVLPAAEGSAEREEQELNEVGARIWELCDGAHSVQDIADAVAEEFDVDEPTARADAVEFVRELLEQKLLIHGDHATGPQTSSRT